jgi:VWFA-related protein
MRNTRRHKRVLSALFYNSDDVLTASVVTFVVLGLAQQSVFKAQAPLVAVPVTVQDKAGKSIDGLTAGDFIVLDDGRPTRVEVDPSGTYDGSVSAVVVIQTNDIAASALAKIKKIGSLMDGLIAGENGDVALLSASDDVLLVQDFTSDGVLLRKAFQSLKAEPDRSAKIIDAVARAVEMLAEKTKARRRVIVLISESRDRGSSADFADVLAHAQDNQVIVYSASYSAYLTPFTMHDYKPPEGGEGGILAGLTEMARLGKINVSEELAVRTGGFHSSFVTLNALEKRIAAFGNELHSQYVLSFAPAPVAERAYHRIEVSVAGHPEATVRFRAGYWAEPPSQPR